MSHRATGGPYVCLRRNRRLSFLSRISDAERRDLCHNPQAGAANRNSIVPRNAGYVCGNCLESTNGSVPKSGKRDRPVVDNCSGVVANRHRDVRRTRRDRFRSDAGENTVGVVEGQNIRHCVGRLHRDYGFLPDWSDRSENGESVHRTARRGGELRVEPFWYAPDVPRSATQLTRWDRRSGRSE